MIHINKMLKPTIISISMATVMAGAAISPALALIAKAFPEADPILIKLILTAPSLMIIPFSFLASFLTSKLTKRTIVLTGLLIYLFGGVGSQFANSIEVLLAGRLILGAGVGLVMPLSMSLINDYFTGKERVKMMGYNSAFSNFGGIITIMLAGYLATFGWRIPFNVYFMGLIIFILVFFFLPKNAIQKKDHNKPKKRIPFTVFGYALAMGGVMLAYYSISTNMALYLKQNNLGGASLAGTVISFTTIGGMITSLILVRLQVLLKQFIIPVTLFGMVLAFTLLSFTHSVPLVIVAVCFIGFGQGILFPIIMLKAIDCGTSNQSDRVVAITSSFTFLGQFLSPIVLDGVGNLFHTASIRFQYGVLAICVFVVFATILFIKLTPTRQLKRARS